MSGTSIIAQISMSLNKSMEAIDSQGVASFYSRGLIGRIYVGNY